MLQISQIRKLHAKMIQRIMALDEIERAMEAGEELVGETQWITKESEELPSLVPCRIKTDEGHKKVWVEKTHACNEKCKFYYHCSEKIL